jgi:hypothetical protein
MGKKSGLGVLRKLASSSKSKSKNETSNSSGYLGSVGHFGGGAMGVINCDADDDSWYCKLSKFYSSIMMIVMLIGLCILLYVLYNMYRSYSTNSTMKGGKIYRGGSRGGKR